MEIIAFNSVLAYAVQKLYSNPFDPIYWQRRLRFSTKNENNCSHEMVKCFLNTTSHNEFICKKCKRVF